MTARSKESFADRLDREGVLDKIAESIVMMYTNPKAPPEIYQYFLSTLGTTQFHDIDKLLLENQELRKKISSLKSQIAELESKTRK